MILQIQEDEISKGEGEDTFTSLKSSLKSRYIVKMCNS